MKHNYLLLLLSILSLSLSAQISPDRDVTFNMTYPATMSYVNSGPDYYRQLGIQSDGKVIIVGPFYQLGGSPNRYSGIMRLNTDGSYDSTFNGDVPGANYNVTSIYVLPDDKIIIGGGFTAYSGNTCGFIARLNADGTFDNTFNVGGAGFTAIAVYPPVVRGLTVQSDGKILVVGAFSAYNGDACNLVVRLNPDGTRDTGFNIASLPNNLVENIYPLSSGKYLVTGKFSSFAGYSSRGIVRLNANGTVDNTFTSGINIDTGNDEAVHDIAILPDNKIIVVGNFRLSGGTTANGIVRLNENGSRDTSYYVGTGLGATGIALDILQLPNGKALITGDFNSVQGVTRGEIALLNADGTLDTGFNSNPGMYDGSGFDLKLASDGKIYVCMLGTTAYQGIPIDFKYLVIRLNGDATLSTTNQELTDLNVKIYPNPSNGTFTVSVPEEMVGAAVSIHNLLGQKVKEYTQSALESNQYLPTGVYNVSIEKDGLKDVQKIVIN